MSNSAIIKRRLLETREFRRLGWRAQFLFLRMCPYCDDYARITLDPRELRWKVWADMPAADGFSDEDVVGALDKMVELGFLWRYEVRGEPYGVIEYMVTAQKYDHKIILRAECPNPVTFTKERDIMYCDLIALLSKNLDELGAVSKRGAAGTILTLKEGRGMAPAQGALALLSAVEGSGFSDDGVCDVQRIVTLRRMGFTDDWIRKHFQKFGRNVESVVEALSAGGNGNGAAAAAGKKVAVR